MRFHKGVEEDGRELTEKVQDVFMGGTWLRQTGCDP